MTEGQTGQPTAEQQRIAQLEADANKYKEQAQTWMGKFTTIEKTLNGKSLEALIAAAEERDILARQAAEKDPKKFDEEVNRVRQEFAPKLEEKDKTISTLSSQLKELTIVDVAIKKAGDAIYPKAADDFRSYVRAHCDLDDDKNVVVKDANGKVRYSPSNPSVLMTVDELIAELKVSRDHWFSSKVPPGGHEPNKGGSASGLTLTTYQDMLKAEKSHGIAAVKDAYAKLPNETKQKIRQEMRAAGVQV